MEDTFDGGRKTFDDSKMVELCDDDAISDKEEHSTPDEDTDQDMGERSLESRLVNERPQWKTATRIVPAASSAA